MTLQGVLITGTYGTGKSSVVEELAELLEDAGLFYGAIDLDYLIWFDADVDDERREKIFLSNVAAVVRNYIDAGIERFLMALAIRDRAQLEAIRGAVPVPLKVVRLCVPFSKIEARLRSDVTVGRQRDLQSARKWVAESLGVGLEDLTVSNDRAIRETSLEVLNWLGWSKSTASQGE